MTYNHKITRFFKVLLLIVAVPNIVFAAAKISINRGSSDPIPFYLDNPEFNSYALGKMPQQVRELVIKDLEQSGLFEHTVPIDITDATADYFKEPDFTKWRRDKVTAVITVRVDAIGKNEIRFSYRIWDMLSKSLVKQQQIVVRESNWRVAAHRIANDIYFQLSGDEGYFDTKITYISETGPFRKRVKRVAIMDQDGANHRFLSSGKYLALTPIMSPNQKKVVYLSYRNSKKPRLYAIDLVSGKEHLIGEFVGMNFAPRFSPDSQHMLMSIAHRGNTNIYELDLKTMKKKQLTRSSAIETSPFYSPDGKEIVFVSDRSGRPQLYMMPAGGGSAKRISYGNGIYSSPAWSPRGDWIAFTKHGFDGNFYIGVMRPDGSGERLITRGYLVESPSWSPNGRRIIYTRQEPVTNNSNVRSKLYSIDLTGLHEIELKTPLDGSDAFWGHNVM